MDFLWDILQAIFLLVVLFMNGSAIVWIASKNSNFPFTSRWQWKSPLAIDALIFCLFISLSLLVDFGGGEYDEGAYEEEAATVLTVLSAIYAISYLVMALKGGTKKIRVRLNDAGVGKAGLIKLLLGLSVCSLLIRFVAAFLTMALMIGAVFLIGVPIMIFNELDEWSHL